MEQIEDDYEFEDETLMERLWGLSEMFPEGLRSLSSKSVEKSISGSKTLFEWSKIGLWVFASSFAIMILPVICEQERSNLEELQSQQQKQILLGPSAAQSASSAPNLIPGMMAPSGR